MAYPERIVPEHTSPGILALHLKRYEFALGWSRDADVLDAGCGSGYGAAFLAPTARRVTGVDNSPEALAYARRTYAAGNLEFTEADLHCLPFAEGSFDLVCAFETIEHLDDPRRFVGEARRVLRPGGTLLVSTPRSVDGTGAPANPFHRAEYTASSFERLLAERFGAVQLYGQRRLQTRRHRLVQRLDVLGLRRRLPPLPGLGRALGTRPTEAVTLEGIAIERGRLDDASELVAVCRRSERG